MTAQAEQKDEEIRKFIRSMNLNDGAKYSSFEADKCREYNGCSDSNYSDAFLTKLWNELLIPNVFMEKESYENVNVLAINSVNGKVFKYAPENSAILSLNNDFYCYIASKAILQNTKLDWEPTVNFGSISDYFSLESTSLKRSYNLVMMTFEEDNKYYKTVDSDSKLSSLPYFLYCMVRGAEFVLKNHYICAVVPSKHASQLKNFDFKAYGIENFTISGTINDQHHTAVIFKKA